MSRIQTKDSVLKRPHGDPASATRLSGPSCASASERRLVGSARAGSRRRRRWASAVGVDRQGRGPEVVAEGLSSYTTWREGVDRAVAEGSRPSIAAQTVTQWAKSKSSAGGTGPAAGRSDRSPARARSADRASIRRARARGSCDGAAGRRWGGHPAPDDSPGAHAWRHRRGSRGCGQGRAHGLRAADSRSARRKRRSESLPARHAVPGAMATT